MATRGVKRVSMLATFAVAVLAFSAFAVAAVVPPLNASYTGTSKHKHYGIQLSAGCYPTTASCHRTGGITASVSTGSAAHPNGYCGFESYQLSIAKLKKGKFSTSGQFLAGPKNHLVTFKVSGRVTSTKRAIGTITGSRHCGGKDGFRAVLSQPTS